MSKAHTQVDSWAFCEDILPDVSRSFAIIIPQCPEPIDRGLCVAYLICRIADTIEDEPTLSADRREQLYDALLATIDDPEDSGKAEAFLHHWPAIPSGDYGRLIQGTGHVLTSFADLPSTFHAPIRACVGAMIAGMRQMRPLERIGSLDFYCRDLNDLDRYCHFVAGVVGIMSTALFETRLADTGFVATDEWREAGRRMGLGLQMTNILKDYRTDAERGVSFIPRQFLDPRPPYPLTPSGWLTLLQHTIGHLDAAMGYIRAIPASETGIRTFLLGSSLPAIATLEVAVDSADPTPKIDRAKMMEILELIAVHGNENQQLDAWYHRHVCGTLAIAQRDARRRHV